MTLKKIIIKGVANKIIVPRVQLIKKKNYDWLDLEKIKKLIPEIVWASLDLAIESC